MTHSPAPLAPPPSVPPSAAQNLSALGSTAQETPYEDLLGLWSDLEAACSLLLGHPLQVHQLPAKVQQLDNWLQELIARDNDSALYAMFQLAGSSTAGYSASHALVCATLSHILAAHFVLPQQERDALVHAALTMNIGMTQLQNQLAVQRERPSIAQQEAIRSHPADGQRLLRNVGVSQRLWLDVVGLHHISSETSTPLAKQPVAERLARILATCDRYAAMISPRRTRPGRSVAESAQAITGPQARLYEQVGNALIDCIGYFPPGIFVALQSQEVAVVLRRSSEPNCPWVAKLLDARKAPLRQPELIATDAPEHRISHALPAHDVKLHVDHRTLVQLGLYAARFNTGLHALVSTPGAR